MPATALHPGGAHALNLADALVPTLEPRDVRWARAQLALRAKGELRPARSGAVPVHGAWSSTALVCSSFGAWRRDPRGLRLAGLGPFDELRLEERLHIPHGGGTPNLDVALEAPGVLVGVESKLTEHLAPAGPAVWRPAYERPAMARVLEGGWAELFAALREGRWAPRFAPAAQLVKHALSLQGLGAGGPAERHLVLLWWEPADGDEVPEVVAHREEVAELLARVGDAPPRLHALTHAQLHAGWEGSRPDHVAALRARYDVALSAAGPPRPPSPSRPRGPREPGR